MERALVVAVLFLGNYEAGEVPSGKISTQFRNGQIQVINADFRGILLNSTLETAR